MGKMIVLERTLIQAKDFQWGLSLVIQPEFATKKYHYPQETQ